LQKQSSTIYIEDAFGEEGDLQKGVVVWQAVMLGWLPSVIQIGGREIHLYTYKPDGPEIL
jgi:hypothetical protein